MTAHNPHIPQKPRQSVRLMTQAYHMRAKGERVSKKEAFAALNNLADSIPEEHRNPTTDALLRDLFNYFQPNKPKKPKNIWDWLSAVAMRDDRTRPHLTYIHADDMTIQVTDGHRIYAVLNDDDVDPGWYIPSTKDRVDEAEVERLGYVWPKTDRYVQGTEATIEYGSLSLEDFTDVGTVEDKPRVDALELVHREEDGTIHRHQFNRRYIEEAMSLPVEEVPTATLSPLTGKQAVGHIRLLWPESGILAVIQGRLIK